AASRSAIFQSTPEVTTQSNGAGDGSESQMLQANTLLVGKRMFRRQYCHQRFEPNRLDIECGSAVRGACNRHRSNCPMRTASSPSSLLTSFSNTSTSGYALRKRAMAFGITPTAATLIEP